LDTIRDFAGAVAVGTGHFLHCGWVHPRSTGFGGDCSRNQAGARAQSRLVERTQT
jgi:hypothetical protein